jgi:hypothetical protein
MQRAGFLIPGESWHDAEKRLNDEGATLLKAALEDLEPWRTERGLWKRWRGFRTVHRVILAELAGASEAGLVLTDRGKAVDRGRFAAAVDGALRFIVVEERRYLCQRWHTILTMVRPLTRPDPMPSLLSEERQLRALQQLTGEVLQAAHAIEQETPSLLVLGDVLRDVMNLLFRERRMFDRGEVALFNPEYRAEVTTMLYETLPPALRAAATEVDRLALSDEVRSPLARPPHSVELQREHAVLIATSPEQDGALGDDPAEQPASELWPPPEHPSVRWLDLSEMEREYVTVLLKAGKQAVREVHQLAKQARGRVTPNRHDKAAALSLDDRGLTEKVGRTGRRLIAVPREMPDRE